MPVAPIAVRAATDDAIDAAAAMLRDGELVAFPTETVYGLGADATDATALHRVFAAKGRPADHPLIVHLAGAEDLERWATDVPESAHRLAAAFWPGPLTLIVRRGAGISPVATGGRDTVGLRVPDHPVALALLARAGRPVAAPSANRFGRVSPTTAADVAAEFAGADDGPSMVLDGGACRVGVESTIVELVGDRPMLLRPGGLPAEFIEDELHQALATPAGPSRASGMLPSHYAPSALVELVEPARADLATRAAAAHLAAGRRVALIGLAPGDDAVAAGAALRLGDVADTDEYARSLYRWLRAADEAGADVVVAVLPPPSGLGRAVQDRLRKAAAPRP